MIAVTEPPYTSFANLRIANIEAIFRSKAILLLSRQTSRDLFDIWYFIARFGKTMSDVVKEMMAVNKYTTAGQNLAWIKTAKQKLSDPGFLSLVPDGPQDFDEVKALLVQAIDQYEKAAAAELIKLAPKF